MQLGVRLAAVLLALTSITPVAQAAAVLREFTLIDGTGRDPVPGSTLVVDGGRESVEQQLRICAAYAVTAAQILGTDHACFDIRAGQRTAQRISRT